MIHTLKSLLEPALMERLTLVVNHVVSSEPAAVARLQPHAGRLLQLDLEGWPSLLPPPPVLAFRVTPAGLVEWCSEASASEADLHVRLDAANPAALALRMLGGEQPQVDIRGPAQLATDVDWLLKNLRWDVGADLQRLFGPVAAGELQRLGGTLARAMRSALQKAAELPAMAARFRRP
jgi:ubiquinone biosynthesis protein UbiJ